jgi:ABC-type antimicrobial peptide transport system permease subunit
MRPGTYEPLAQGNAGFLQVAVRARPGADPLSIVPAVRSASAELDPGLPIYDVQTMGERIDESLLGRRSLTTLFSVFSAIALFLAVAGLYGVISYTVGQRAGEISVRMALGAPGTRVAREVVRQGMAMVAVGLALGLGLAWSVGGTLSGLLVGGRATDLSVYAAVAGLLLAVAFVANWVPARRAAGVNPMQSLRGE